MKKKWCPKTEHVPHEKRGFKMNSYKLFWKSVWSVKLRLSLSRHWDMSVFIYFCCRRCRQFDTVMTSWWMRANNELNSCHLAWSAMLISLFWSKVWSVPHTPPSRTDHNGLVPHSYNPTAKSNQYELTLIHTALRAFDSAESRWHTLYSLTTFPAEWQLQSPNLNWHIEFDHSSSADDFYKIQMCAESVHQSTKGRYPPPKKKENIYIYIKSYCICTL